MNTSLFARVSHFAFVVFILGTFVCRAPSPQSHTIAQSERYGIPAEARIIETQALSADLHRALVLWILNPVEHPSETFEGDPYTCPEHTRGSYYTGSVRVSLVNTRTRQIINTIEIEEDDYYGDGETEIPYRIRAGYYYHVPGADEDEEGSPVIMHLRDYNGDGRAAEFALFDAPACMGLGTTLIGYSHSRDRVLQYPIQTTINDPQNGRSVETRLWADYLFSERPVRSGYWRYEIDYRGRGGTLNNYEFRYNREAERFEGTLVRTPDEP